MEMCIRDRYYNIGQVANRVFYNGHNDIDVTLTENATWKMCIRDRQH